MFGLRPIAAKLFNEQEISDTTVYTDKVDTRYTYYKCLQIINSGDVAANIRVQYSANGITWNNMGVGVTTVNANSVLWIDRNDISDLDMCAPWTRISAVTSSGSTTLTLYLAAM